ncbi:MAG: hypothetical protein ACYC57_06525 [Thermoleophilia bacterium]
MKTTCIRLKFLSVLLFSLLLVVFPGCDYLTANSINKYLTEVAEIQHDCNLALLELNQYVSGLAGDTAQINEATTGLEASLTAIDEARERITALEVPEDALELHNDLIELYSTGSSVVTDLIASGRYQLDMEPILKEYEAASSEFSASLQAATDSGSLLASLQAYQATIEAIVKKATPLSAPTIATNSHERFMNNLEVMREGVGEMIAGIEQDDLQAVEGASEKIASISAGNEQLEKDMLADREADIKAYNAQILKMSKLTEKIQHEQAALRERYETDY